MAPSKLILLSVFVKMKGKCGSVHFVLFGFVSQDGKKGFRKDLRRVVLPCGILFKTVERRPAVDLSACLVLFMVQCGDIALLEAENKAIP